MTRSPQFEWLAAPLPFGVERIAPPVKPRGCLAEVFTDIAIFVLAHYSPDCGHTERQPGAASAVRGGVRPVPAVHLHVHRLQAHHGPCPAASHRLHRMADGGGRRHRRPAARLRSGAARRPQACPAPTVPGRPLPEHDGATPVRSDLPYRCPSRSPTRDVGLGRWITRSPLAWRARMMRQRAARHARMGRFGLFPA